MWNLLRQLTSGINVTERSQSPPVAPQMRAEIRGSWPIPISNASHLHQVQPTVRQILLQVDGTPGLGHGQAGLGVVVRDMEGQVLHWQEGRTKATTNNEAEYQAVVLGLRFVADAYPGVAVRCLSDSQLVVDQLTRRTGNRVERLRVLYSEAVTLCERIGTIEFVHVPREVNRLADALAWEALSGTARLVHKSRIMQGGNNVHTNDKK